MNIPTVQQAEAYLQWAEAQNPTFWATHSRIVAKCARTIAEACGMDGDAAYVMGLLHDLGRYEGWTYMRHIYAGYQFLIDKGYADAARICVTHSFALQNINRYVGGKDQNDCTVTEYEIVRRVLEDTQYDDYDRLIQLCDGMVGNKGAVLMEKRLVNVVMRYGINEFTLPDWQARFELLDYFDNMVGGAGGVYRLFPDVAENTFS